MSKRTPATCFDELGLDREKVAARMAPKIRKTRGCWWWTGTSQGNGNHKYGCLRHRVGPRSAGRTISLPAHRLAWWLAHPGKRLDPRLLVLHLCNNPLCVNPAHLTAGTHKQNMQHVAECGSQRGENNPRARLTKELVVELRHRRANGETLKALAAEHDLHLATVDYAVRGKTWKKAGGPIQPSRGHKRDVAWKKTKTPKGA